MCERLADKARSYDVSRRYGSIYQTIRTIPHDETGSEINRVATYVLDFTIEFLPNFYHF